VLPSNCCCYVGETLYFASDTDNINNHGLSKVSSTKDGSSFLVAGNQLPLAVRNQAHLLRLLAYVSTLLHVLI
jgi:hypothetical protein